MASAEPYASKSAPCSRQITMPAPHHSVFYRLYALTAAQPTASRHRRQEIQEILKASRKPGAITEADCVQSSVLWTLHLLMDNKQNRAPTWVSTECNPRHNWTSKFTEARCVCASQAQIVHRQWIPANQQHAHTHTVSKQNLTTHITC